MAYLKKKLFFTIATQKIQIEFWSHTAKTKTKLIFILSTWGLGGQIEKLGKNLFSAHPITLSATDNSKGSQKARICPDDQMRKQQKWSKIWGGLQG